MDHRPLGTTSLTVPAIGMGTWRTLDVRDEAGRENAARVVGAALDAGANLFDSSPMYGASEEVLARSLGVRRREAIVATKVWTSSAADGRRQVARALAWYGGKVEIYQVHNLVAWREHLPMLERLREEGKITVVGITHYDHGAFDDLAALMKDPRVQQVQLPYNALDRAVERTLLPLAADRGLGVLVMRPLGEGSLVRNAPSAEKLAPLKPFGVTTWAQALLKWVVSDARVHCAIPATSRPSRAAENAAAGDPPFFDREAREYVAGLVRG